RQGDAEAAAQALHGLNAPCRARTGEDGDNVNPCDRSGRVSVKARRVIFYGRYKAEEKFHIKLKCDLHHKTIHYNRRKIKRLVLTAGMRCHSAVFF
ncbi:hypothetical protein, partial [Enterobacter hormaechei]|uniref:hypothetical protein n=1 Tax=Enterobacter hormaechei TaxID=158836 RepID=UPI003315C134